MDEPTCVTFTKKLKMVGVAQLTGSLRASPTAAPSSILGIPENVFLTEISLDVAKIHRQHCSALYQVDSAEA